MKACPERVPGVLRRASASAQSIAVDRFGSRGIMMGAECYDRIDPSPAERPNALRFCCGGLRRPPPSQQTYPAAGRRAQAPGSSKRGLGGTMHALKALAEAPP